MSTISSPKTTPIYIQPPPYESIHPSTTYILLRRRRRRRRRREVHSFIPRAAPMARRRAVDAEAELNLPPGFRFHPTDEELVVQYLCKKVAYQRLPVPIIAEVDLYKYDPWQLPEKALFGQQEWYFFTPRDRKYPNGSRPNRAAGTGYWKATGADKPVTPKGRSRPVGIKKALVFYSGKAPRGVKTDWIMHEYRLADTDRSTIANKKDNLRLDEWVLCRLYHKKNNWVKKQQGEVVVVAAASSFEETTTTMDSFGGAVDDTGSDSFCRSDIENESFFHPPQAYNEAQGAAARAISVAEVQVKEDNDWFMDLNLDDLQSPFGNFGSSTTTTADMTNQDYFQVLDSPQMRRTLPNLPPF